MTIIVGRGTTMSDLRPVKDILQDIKPGITEAEALIYLKDAETRRKKVQKEVEANAVKASAAKEEQIESYKYITNFSQQSIKLTFAKTEEFPKMMVEFVHACKANGFAFSSLHQLQWQCGVVAYLNLYKFANMLQCLELSSDLQDDVVLVSRRMKK